MKQIVPAHQGVAGSAKEIEPGASGDQEPEFFSKKIIGPLEDVPPAMALVDFIEDDPGLLNAQGPGRRFIKPAVRAAGFCL